MNEDIEKLQRMLEQATAAKEASEDGLDPETASLREAWIGFGQLLDVAEASTNVVSLPLIERPMVKATPRSIRPRRRLLSTAALLAASLLLGIATAWIFKTRETPVQPLILPEQAAAADQQTQWDDSFDEQIAQIGQQIAYVQQSDYSLADDSGLIQYQLEQLHLNLETNGL